VKPEIEVCDECDRPVRRDGCQCDFDVALARLARFRARVAELEGAAAELLAAYRAWAARGYGTVYATARRLEAAIEAVDAILKSKETTRGT